jgi:hypothetical protein
VSLLLTVVNLAADLPDRVVDSAILASLGFIIYFSTQVYDEPAPSMDSVLLDREGFEPFRDFISGAKVFHLYAPLGINVVVRHAGDLREQILDKGGKVRIVVMDPSSPYVSMLADQTTRVSADSAAALETSLSLLDRMKTWGDFKYRLMYINPGFAVSVVDPKEKLGRLSVEFHGFRDDSPRDRMHLTLRYTDSPRWFNYWAARFEAIWEASREPDE